MPLPGGYLLDTNILLALVRGNRFGQYLDTMYGLSSGRNRFVLSVVTVGELYSLARKLRWGAAKRSALTALLDTFEIIDINDPQILQAYGELDAVSDSRGRSMGKNDVWIAATARETRTTLLTSDKDFDHLRGVGLDCEWVDPLSG